MTAADEEADPADRPGPGSGEVGRGGRLNRTAIAAGRLLLRHWAFVLLVGAGAGIRLLMMVAYNPAFFFIGDSRSYLKAAWLMKPDPMRPSGYSLLLWLLMQPSYHPLFIVPLLQHTAGLALIIAMYVFLQRQGVSRTVSVLAIALPLLDARTIVLEHYVLSDAPFTVLIVGALLVLCWRRRPGWGACLAAGLLFGAACLTRSVGLAMLPLVLAYLVIRWAGWRQLAVFTIAALLPVGGYVLWVHQDTGNYSITPASGRYLWARVSTFVQCDKVPDLTAEERQLCPPQPLGHRLVADLYLWTPGPNKTLAASRYDPLFSSFASKVIRAQPVDFATMTAGETWNFLRPGPYPNSRVACFAALWSLPAPKAHAPRLPSQYRPLCQPNIATGTLRKAQPDVVASTVNGRLPTWLHRYAKVATVPGTVLGLAFLLVIGMAMWRPRRPALRDALTPLLWGGVGFAIIVVSMATSVNEPRYGLPALPLTCVGAALAWQRLRAARTTDQPEPGRVEEQAAEG